MIDRALIHIAEVARIPSFSSYEERLHPYVKSVFRNISTVSRIDAPGNNLVYKVPGNVNKMIALTAHLDKIDHYGPDSPSQLPVKITSEFIEGAMDDSLGVGVLLTLAELSAEMKFPELLFFFSEMEESKGLKEHPERLRNNGQGYESGMGAKRIAGKCLQSEIIPEQVITIDTTPLFKGEPGIALYTKHWELNEIDARDELIRQTQNLRERFGKIYSDIKFANNTNDYLHYGKLFNQSGNYVVPSVALEPSIFPYHQKGERIFLSDLKKVLNILVEYLNQE